MNSQMTSAELHELLDSVEDTREIVTLRADCEGFDGDQIMLTAWVNACTRAEGIWRQAKGKDCKSAFASYLAAQDQVDAARAAYMKQVRRSTKSPLTSYDERETTSRS